MRRWSRRATLGATLLAGVLVASGCAVESAPDWAMPSSDRRSGAAMPSGPARDAFAEFVRTNGFEALPTVEVLLGGVSDADAVLRVRAVVADDPTTRSRGLMGVADLPADVGMLFAFPDRPDGGRPGFWMLDTVLPLDIVFASDGIVVGVASMQPCEGPPCPVTHPGVDYDVALEVASGTLAAARIAPGDRFVRRPGSPPAGHAPG